jgi:hypothetical protein
LILPYSLVWIILLIKDINKMIDENGNAWYYKNIIKFCRIMTNYRKRNRELETLLYLS